MKTDGCRRLEGGAGRLRARASRRRRAGRPRGPPRGLRRLPGRGRVAARRRAAAPPRRPGALRPGAAAAAGAGQADRGDDRRRASARSSASAGCASGLASAEPPRRPRRRCWRSSSSPAASEQRPRAARRLPRPAQGVKIGATLEPQAFGTEIHMYVKGIRSGTLCRVYMRGPGGEDVSAGTFRYRWGGDASAVLSAALDLSRAEALVVHAGKRTFVAPLDAAKPTTATHPKRRNRRDEVLSRNRRPGADRAARDRRLRQQRRQTRAPAAVATAPAANRPRTHRLERTARRRHARRSSRQRPCRSWAR